LVEQGVEQGGQRGGAFAQRGHHWCARGVVHQRRCEQLAQVRMSSPQALVGLRVGGLKCLECPQSQPGRGLGADLCGEVVALEFGGEARVAMHSNRHQRQRREQGCKRDQEVLATDQHARDMGM
jgi:hypothetical protein